MSKVPAALSAGEELLAQHLDCYRIPYEREVCLIAGRKFRTDFRVGDLAIEVDGGTWTNGRHARGAGIKSDCEKLNLLTLAGFRHLRFTTEQVVSGYAIDTVRAALKQQGHPVGCPVLC